MTELRRSRTELLMTSAPLPWRLPLTIAGRSPFDPIRLRWGGLGCIALGALITGTGEVAGLVFGILLILLGLATWPLTGFGGIGWSGIDTPGRYVAGRWVPSRGDPGGQSFHAIRQDVLAAE